MFYSRMISIKEIRETLTTDILQSVDISNFQGSEIILTTRQLENICNFLTKRIFNYKIDKMHGTRVDERGDFPELSIVIKSIVNYCVYSIMTDHVYKNIPCIVNDIYNAHETIYPTVCMVTDNPHLIEKD